jgi:alpha-L-rhamnosidase
MAAPFLKSVPAVINLSPNSAMRFLITRGIWLLAMLAAPSLFAGLVATNLECGYWTNPLGVDDLQPRLTWQLQATTPGQRGDLQIACRVLVASSTNLLANNQGDLWDSGQTNVTSPSRVYGGVPLVSEQQVFWKVAVWNQNNQTVGWSPVATWSMGLLNPSDWQGSWIMSSNTAALPIFRREFTVQPGLQRAIIYLCGLGQYELSANGTKVGNALLAPGWSMYPKTCLYDTLDVTSYLTNGANALGVMLGNGMYNVPSSSRYAKFTGSFGPPKLIAQVHLFYTNGTSQVIASDASWLTTPGPITFSSVYGGEDHDARLLPAGWNQAGFNATGWSAPTVTTGPGGVLRGQSHAAPPIVATQTLQPVQTNVISSSVIVYDLGQNASLIPILTTHGPAGSVVQITPAEAINANGTVNRTSVGGGSAYWQYTLAGTGSEMWFPRFFYHGCRYLQVQLTAASGSSQLPVVDNLQGVAIQSAVSPVGTFSCSIPLFNQTEALIRWAQRNNLISILTDCPTRERLGWLEEAHLNGPSLRYEFDLDKFTRCSMDAMADSQLSNGLVPSIAPEFTVFSGGFRDSPEWGSSVILVPWQQYQFTGDDTLLRQYYGAMTNYLAYLQTQSSGYLLNYGLGDWYDIGPNAEGYEQLTPLGVTATAYFYQDAQTLAQIATETGNASDAARFGLLAANIATAFNNNYYSAANGYYANGSQTSQAMPLMLGIVNPTNRAPVLSSLVANVTAQGSTTGEIGHRYLLRALTDGGRADVVFNINNLTNNSPNTGGYGYMLSQGATSATEGWNANPSDSLDHFMWGQIIEWFYHDLAGIQSDPAAPGFKNVVIKPALVGSLTWVNANYNSLLGPVISNWTLTNNVATLTATIPPGTTGKIYLPTLGTPTNGLEIHESGVTVWQNGAVAGSSPGVTFADVEGAGNQTFIVWNVGSGTYQFSWNIFPAPAGLTAVAGNSEVTLSWNPVAGATSYTVQRSLTSGTGYVTLTNGFTATNFTDASAVNGTNYYYVVAAANGSLQSLNSSEVSAIAGFVLNFGFETPSVGTYQSNPSGASWAFTPQSGANGSGIAANGSAFTIYNTNAPQGIQVAFLQGVSTIAQTINGFTPGSNYTVTFAAAQRNYQQNGGQTWNLMLDGNIIGSFAPPRAATNYVDYSTNFMATATSHTLAFAGTDSNGGDNAAFLDNVRIVLAASNSPVLVTPLVQLIATNFNPGSLIWNDSSGHNNNATYSGSSNPGLVSAATPNGSAAVNLTGAGSFLLAALLSPINGYTVFAYVQPARPNGSGRQALTGGSSPTALEYDIYNGQQDYLTEYTTDIGHGNAAIPANRFSLLGLAVNTSGANFRFNGANDGTIAGATFGSAITRIGNNEGGGEGFAGQIAEIDIYSGALTSAQITNVEAQFTAKYINAIVASNPTTITAVVVGGSLQLSWPADHTGWTLQMQSNPPAVGLTTNWVRLAGSSFTNQLSLPMYPGGGSAFFRLVFP